MPEDKAIFPVNYIFYPTGLNIQKIMIDLSKKIFMFIIYFIIKGNRFYTQLFLDNRVFRKVQIYQFENRPLILTYKNILPLPCENLVFSSLDFFIRAFF